MFGSLNRKSQSYLIDKMEYFGSFVYWGDIRRFLIRSKKTKFFRLGQSKSFMIFTVERRDTFAQLHLTWLLVLSGIEKSSKVFKNHFHTRPGHFYGQSRN